MNPLYYQYGNGGPAMQTPDYQTFLALLEQMRKMNGGSPADGGGSGGGQQGQGQGGGGMSGLGSLFKMFGGGAGSAAPSMGNLNGAATPGYFDSPSGGIGGMGGIAGMFA
jgi:hypothetical protein